MALRGKNKRTERSKLDATPPWDDRVREPVPETTGPYDELDAPDDDVQRADLGALRVPVGAGLDLRLEVNEQQQVIAVTLAANDGSMQLGVYAAPRTEGIWDDVRAEIAESMKEQKGVPKERADGAFGVELTGTVPGDGGRLPARFIGIDGPRWFLRAMLVGAPADPARAARYEDLLRNVVVVRGAEPLPVRDPVPLRLPKEVVLPAPEDVIGES
ncbi:DUF3710 domain-containing protein [Jatrophihabitans sp.]|uniref:DUF3710 domain-containing protein n=1 Tax=Jatrophihabitans sp. TaxID=1932789 RepID=UPI0030C73E72|nr:uncharacterized protein [Jatrophihabitans sp.]